MKYLLTLSLCMFFLSATIGQTTTQVYVTSAPTPEQSVQNQQYFDQIEEKSTYITVDPSLSGSQVKDKFILDAQAFGIESEKIESHFNQLDHPNLQISYSTDKTKVLITVLDSNKVGFKDLVHSLLWEKNYR